MKILHITPHLSTGGLPQYLEREVNNGIKNKDEIFVLERNYISCDFVVQRNRLKDKLGDRLISWDQGRSRLEVLNDFKIRLVEINPDIIWLSEFPESFLDDEFIELIYKEGKQWEVYETTHNSEFRLIDKRTKPDRFVFVSEFHKELFKDYGVDIEVNEYKVEINKLDKNESLGVLGLDKDGNKKHVLIIGLFTPNKNQKYALELAKLAGFGNIEFHFIGNTAPNFRQYWEPLLSNIPANCRVWGERSDLEYFYSIADLIVFPSYKELMPLVLLEAEAYGVPVIRDNLSIYKNRFNNPDWLDLSRDLLKDLSSIISKLGIKPPKIKLVHLLTNPEDAREVKSINNLKLAENFGVEYTQIINKPCVEYPSNKTSLTKHIEKKPGYYGAYLAFKGAFEDKFDEDTDFLCICECDCFIPSDGVKTLIEFIYKSLSIEFDYVSFGYNYDSSVVENIDNEFYYTNKIIHAHCVGFKQASKEYILDKYKTVSWDSPDLFLNHVFGGKKKLVLHYPIAIQNDGISLIDGCYKTHINQPKDHIRCDISFCGQPKVSISGQSDKEYKVKFMDGDNGLLIYETYIKANHWASVNRWFFTNWDIIIECEGNEILKHSFNLENKNVVITFSSKSLGDTLAWMPYVDEFQKKHKCNLVVSTNWNGLFVDEYKNIKFSELGETVKDTYASYLLGCFDDDLSRHKNDWRVVPLQQVASDFLGLEYAEKKPLVSLGKLPRSHNRPYIALAEFSTMRSKLWNRTNGWQELVDEIRLLGYDVLSVSYELSKLKRVRRCNGRSIESTIRNILHSEAFIGVGSGLSWLAWALDKPVVMISGFSGKFCEFTESEKVARIINEDVCHGCFNDLEYVFDRGDWGWCPRGEDFVCSKEISVEMVLNGLKKVLGLI